MHISIAVIDKYGSVAQLGRAAELSNKHSCKTVKHCL